MPSAEKSSSAAVKLECAPQNEPKVMEGVQKENASESSPLFCLNQIVSMISNKVRNLEKRKNKLDGYIKEEEDGGKLSSEQEKAVSKYDEVVQQLSLAKEFNKQFGEMARHVGKEAKREARNAVFARQIQEKTKVRDVLMIQDLLHRLSDANVRNDFLNERNGACLVSLAEMDFIDKFAQQTVPTRPSLSTEQSFENAAKTSAEYFCFVIDGRNKVFQDTGLTYEKARVLFSRIQTCGYWEKDVKFVESTLTNTNTASSSTTMENHSRAENDTPNSDDLVMTKDDVMQSENLANVHRHQQPMLPVASPAPNQVPTFNGGNMNMTPNQQQQQQQRMAAANMNMKTTVVAVESAYFNQMKFSQQQQQQQQQPMSNNVLPVGPTNPSDFASSFSFLQDSELEIPQQQQQQQQKQQQQQQAGSQKSQQSQQKMPVNVIQTIAQPKHSPIQQSTQQQHQQQHQVNTASRPANFTPTQMYPPGLKVQPHIPINYQQQQSTQVPHMIPKQVPTMEHQQKQQTSTRPAYPTSMVPSQNLTTVKSIEQQLHQQQIQHQQQNIKKIDVGGSGDRNEPISQRDIEKSTQREQRDRERDEYQQQPQIDTWTNETANQTGNGHNGNSNFPARSGGFNRNNRASGGEKKFNNNFRSSHQSRVYENGDQPQQQSSGGGGGSGTFFRNNERFNGSTANNNGRYENRGGAGGGGSYKPRDSNYRPGSGRFPNASASAQAGPPRK